MIQFDEHIFQMGWFNHQLVKVTPPKINMEPKNATLEKETRLQTTNFGVPC